MLLPQFEYRRAETVEEAVELLSETAGARALAGGASLINFLKLRVAPPDRLVDISRVGSLKTIEVHPDGALELGAGVTFAELLASPAAGAARPIVAQVAATLADAQVRNRATVGGNICNHDLNNNLPPLFSALQAEMTIMGTGGQRTVPAAEFFRGPFTTAIGHGELLTRVRIPARAAGEGDGWAAVRIGADGPGIVNVAATTRDGRARIALGAVAGKPVVLTCAAEEDAVREAVRTAELTPPADVHASSEYRRHLAEVLAVRAVRDANHDGGGTHAG
ncbi:FAD binding domain-containing protein [Amycolatopsis jejuensis]|uniref:FAD binding domain-containing protein n=1 Tax=Amycolatopsis jejuensis TaxID=330084 RepID=UPI00068ED07A|nr:FAD binding domain-containing protein [Amycolatopsis jejuensis]